MSNRQEGGGGGGGGGGEEGEGATCAEHKGEIREGEGEAYWPLTHWIWIMVHFNVKHLYCELSLVLGSS